MWNLIFRVGMVLSTVLIGKQFFENFWPTEIRPTKLYHPHQIARYLGTNTQQVLELIQGGTLGANWVRGEPMILGACVLELLSKRT